MHIKAETFGLLHEHKILFKPGSVFSILQVLDFSLIACSWKMEDCMLQYQSPLV